MEYTSENFMKDIREVTNKAYDRIKELFNALKNDDGVLNVRDIEDDNDLDTWSIMVGEESELWSPIKTIYEDGNNLMIDTDDDYEEILSYLNVVSYHNVLCCLEEIMDWKNNNN